MVEILNENDNFPEFTEDTVQSLDLSEVLFSWAKQMCACCHNPHGSKVDLLFFFR